MTQLWKPGFEKRIDVAGHSTYACVEKWDPDQVAYVKRMVELDFGSGPHEPLRHELIRYCEPGEVLVDNTPNLTTTGGRGRLTSSLTGAAPVVFSGVGTTVLGVGSSATTELPADTNLTAALWWQVADSTPTITTTTVTNDTIQVVATFASANGNGAWNEWGLGLVTTAVSAATLATAGTGGLMFNHKVASLGTKSSGASWAFTVKLTWS